jgi:hypothetical protein
VTCWHTGKRGDRMSGHDVDFHNAGLRREQAQESEYKKRAGEWMTIQTVAK